MPKICTRRRARSIDQSIESTDNHRVLSFVRTCRRRARRGFSRLTRYRRTLAISPTIDPIDRSRARSTRRFTRGSFSRWAPDLIVGTERLRLRLKSRIYSRQASKEASARERAHSMCKRGLMHYIDTHASSACACVKCVHA